jgi:hypothetical protein
MCPFVTRKATEWQCYSRYLLCKCALISEKPGKPVEQLLSILRPRKLGLNIRSPVR